MTFDRSQSFLPKTATDFLKALDVVEQRLFELPVEMITKDPAKASVEWLDHLAWENSVDVWDVAWSEGVKRAVVAASREVHRYKGTPHAIRTALQSFGITIELVEWFQAGGSGVPGTFLVRAFVTDPLDGAEELIVTGPTIGAMKSMLNSVSPVSRRWSLELGVATPSVGYAGVFATTHLIAVAECQIEPPPLSVSAASFAVIATTQLKSTVTTI